MNEIRNSDHPENKERVMSQLFGEFIGFVKSKGLSKGTEFATEIQEFFQCSRKILWIDDYSPELQMTIYMNSIQLFCEFGVVDKKTKSVIHRNKLENLRYKISSCTQIELIDSHQEKFELFFTDFKKWFEKLSENIQVAT